MMYVFLWIAEWLKLQGVYSCLMCVTISVLKKLALRAGNEKEEGETADTVGCCSLRVEHITLHDHLDDNKCVVEFDFLGKDSIRYYNKVPVMKQVKEEYLYGLTLLHLYFLLYWYSRYKKNVSILIRTEHYEKKFTVTQNQYISL